MIDQTLPTGRWEFDEAVTAVFDNMLERWIPDYENMRALTTDLAVRFAQEGTTILDVGCSRGGALEPILYRLGAANNYVGIEVSEPMHKAATLRFQDVPEVEIRDTDLRYGLGVSNVSVTLAVLTVQFTPIEYRQKIIQRIYDATNSGGAFLLVEKILGSDAFVDDVLVDTYYAMKGEHGYTQEQIAAKRRSLEGVLVPVTAEWNVELLAAAGFKHIDCYWRTLNFAAWIGIKP